MSIEAMVRVWKFSQAVGPARMVLLAIADCCNDEMEAWPGVKSIADKCKISKRQAQTMIRRLATIGELRIEECRGKQSASGATNLYTLLLRDPASIQSTGDEESRMGGMKDRVKKGGEGVKDPSSNPTYRGEPSIESSSLFTHGDEIPLIRTLDDVWRDLLETYPKRDGSLDASEGKRRFLKLVESKKADPEAILAGARLYRKWADDKGKTGTEYIKQIPTWLNKRCWEDTRGYSAKVQDEQRKHPVCGVDFEFIVEDGEAVRVVLGTKDTTQEHFDAIKWYEARKLTPPEAA